MNVFSSKIKINSMVSPRIVFCFLFTTYIYVAKIAQIPIPYESGWRPSTLHLYSEYIELFFYFSFKRYCARQGSPVSVASWRSFSSICYSSCFSLMLRVTLRSPLREHSTKGVTKNEHTCCSRRSWTLKPGVQNVVASVLGRNSSYKLL